MWNYTDKVMELFYDPKNQGSIEDNHEPGVKVVMGEVGSIACGDALRLHLKVEEATNIILDARFQTFGCASAISSSSALTEIIKGKSVDEALKYTNRDIAEFLGGLPEEKMHCSVMGQEALEAAIFTYKGIPLETHEDDDGALVCACFGVSDSRIRRVVQENNLTSAEQVTHYVKAGGGCATCLAQIDDLIAQVQGEKAIQSELAAKIAIAQEQVNVETQDLVPVPRPLSTVQKIAMIQQVLTEEVRPYLAQDGGDVELYDVEGDRVMVLLKGSCDACSSKTQTLKIVIEAKLQQRVLPSLVVEAVNPSQLKTQVG